jgi:YD repeat-containing protein
MAASTKGMQPSVFTVTRDNQGRISSYCQYVDEAAQFCYRYTRNSEGEVTTREYEWNGQVATTVEFRTSYRADGALITEQKSSGGQWSITQVTLTDASGRITRDTYYYDDIVQRDLSYQYDAHGVLVSDTRVEQNHYNSTGFATTTTQHVYDDAGRLTQDTSESTDGASTVTEYTYDQAGRLVEIDSGPAGGALKPRDVWTYDGERVVAHDWWADAQKVEDGPSYVTRYTESYSIGCEQYQEKFAYLFDLGTEEVVP